MKKKPSVWERKYKGLRIKADYRVHDEAFEMITNKLGAKKNIKVLDIATGTGSFAQRITDTFPTWSLDVNDYQSQALVSGMNKHSVDLNVPFADHFSKDGYDLVIGIEIIEHLENPWLFLREIRRVLKDGGTLILSTPNVDSLLDRLVYLTHGHPCYFGANGYINSEGHITMIPDWLLRLIASKSGFNHVELNGRVDTKPFIGLRAMLKMILILPGYLFMQRKNNRSINIYQCT